MVSSRVPGCIKEYLAKKTSEGDPCPIHEGGCTEGFFDLV